MGGFGHQVFTVRSDKDEHFTSGIVQDAGEAESLPMPASLGGRARIVGIRMISTQNLAWEFAFWGEALFATQADYDIDRYLGKHTFAVGDGMRVAGAGPYYYHISDLDIPYRDADHPVSGVSTVPRLHVQLINRSLGAKTAGINGAVVAEMLLIPTN